MNEPAPPPPRRKVSSAASCLAVGVLFVLLSGICCAGSIGLAVRRGAERERDQIESRLVELREGVRRQEEAEALLEEIALRLEALRAVERAYPRALPEAPPTDPWGSDVRYEAGGPDRAWLRSAGPDTAFGTADDLVRELGRR